MANHRRGEIDVELDGKTFRMCLTLGALAELEAAFDVEDMLALASRFQSGRLRSLDAVRIIGAGLRGAGNDIADDVVARMRTQDGAAGFIGIVARLLQATFGSDDAERQSAGRIAEQPSTGAREYPEVNDPVPFLGTT